jgi:hypothetical protein
MIIFYKNIILNLELSMGNGTKPYSSFRMGGKRGEGALKRIVENLK